VVYVIEEGAIVASGSPREVVQQSAWFARFMSAIEFPASEAIE